MNSLELSALQPRRHTTLHVKCTKGGIMGDVAAEKGFVQIPELRSTSLPPALSLQLTTSHYRSPAALSEPA